MQGWSHYIMRHNPVHYSVWSENMVSTLGDAIGRQNTIFNPRHAWATGLQ